jgi:uncharacterized OsmC-like protein
VRLTCGPLLQLKTKSANTDDGIRISAAFGSIAKEIGVLFMPDIKIKARNIGAVTTIERLGQPRVSSFVGGDVDLVTSASGQGFNPLDLLFASLASCLALSFRIAVSEVGLLQAFRKADISVTGVKSQGEPKHIERFSVQMTIDGDFTEEQRNALAHRAEEICTVSNTLKAAHDIALHVD